MHISEFNFNPKILEDRIRAVLKSAYPFYDDIKVNISTVEMMNQMRGPVWDEESRDAVGYPVKEVKFSIDCDLSIRTDFDYENIILPWLKEAKK